MSCDCMVETDPFGGPDIVLTHSIRCDEHPDYEPLDTTNQKD